MPLHPKYFLPLLALVACGEKPRDFYSGYVEADYVRLASPLAGTIAHLHVARGQQVAKDAPLFVLEQESERAERQAAQARVERAQATLTNLRKGKRPDEVAVSQAQLAQADASLKLSQEELARESRLMAANFVSPARLDTLRAAVQRDQARVRELQAQLRVATIGARPDEIAAAQKDIDAAQAELDQAAWRQGQKTVKAPLQADVADVLYREGELVPAGQPVVSLLAPEHVRARFFIPEGKLGAIKLGQEMLLACDGCAHAVRARISFIAPQAEYTAPLIYSQENRATLVFMVEAKPYGEGLAQLHPGQPLEIRFAPH